MVFVHLARKASALVSHPVLPAWLHRSCHLAALELHRKDRRRAKYEKAAGLAVPLLTQSDAIVAWEEVRPVLDDAIDRLDERDRQAILLRYFGNKAFVEIGESLRLSENTARMRVDRALGKLHVLLRQKGISSSSAALALALSGNAVAAAPSGVAVASTAAAMAVTVGSGLAWIPFMSTTKLPIALTAAIVVGGGTVIALQKATEFRTASAIAILSDQNRSIPGLAKANRRLYDQAAQDARLQEEETALPALRDQARVADERDRAAAKGQRLKHPSALDSGEPVIDVSKLDQRPVMVSQGRPEYPQSMRQAGAQGEAIVQFVVGSDGLVYNASAISSTDPAFADAALQAVSHWVFKPGQVAGQNVHTQMQVPIVFNLSQDNPQPSSKSWF